MHLDAADQSERVVTPSAPQPRIPRTTSRDAGGRGHDPPRPRPARLARNDRYEAALEALREDTRDWWADVLAREPDDLDEGEEPATADAEGLRRFLEDEVLPGSRGARRNWRTAR